MKRVGFLFKIKEEHKEEYKKHHQNVWPEVLNVIRRNGRKNYSIFMTPEGFLFGYFESLDGIEKTLSIEDQEINKKWQDFMAPYFENIGNNYLEKRIVTLEEVFHTD